jgi:ribosomal protein S18 acetylase RimI-like enzyme
MHRFYKHFKGKPYRYLGTGKFSESLEEMAIYETLYENPEGKLWVRPKKMFDEVIERDGEKITRFQAVPLSIELFESLPNDELIRDILIVANKVLKPTSLETFKAKLIGKKNPVIVLCRVDNQVVGFKVGFEKSPTTFYSWLGGVDPAFQRLGVASALMDNMTNWCIRNRYESLDTKTTNNNKAMIILNIISGFEVKDLMIGKNGVKKILMSKDLRL